MYLLWFNVIYTLISIKLFNISYVSEYLYKMTSNGPTHIYIWNILILRWKSYKNLKCTHYQSCKISRVHLLHWRNFQSYCKEVSLEVSTTSCPQISSLQDLGNTSESPHTAMIALVLGVETCLWYSCCVDYNRCLQNVYCQKDKWRNEYETTKDVSDIVVKHYFQVVWMWVFLIEDAIKHNDL